MPIAMKTDSMIRHMCVERTDSNKIRDYAREHVILVLQHDDKDHPTDQYVCTRCGSVICNKGALTSV